MRRRIAALGIAALLAMPAWLVVSPEPAEANHSWGNYHWARTSNPFTLKVGDNVSSAWDPYLDEAISSPDFADWSDSSVLNLAEVAGGAVGGPRKCRPTSGRIEVCNANFGFNGWLGIAHIWISGSHITQGTTKLNDSYFNTSTYNKPEWRRLVMCQEIAHDFGLDHQDENFNNANLASCMDYTSDPDGPPSNEHPNQHDYDQIVTIYSHTDSTSTVGATVPPGPGKSQDAGGNSPSEWGTPVRTDGHGRPDVYRKDLGNGERLITHVFNIPPGRPRTP